MELAAPLLWVAAIHLGAWGLGTTLLGALRVPAATTPPDRWIRFALAGVLGLVALAALALALGLVHALHAGAIVAVVTGTVVLALVRLARAWPWSWPRWRPEDVPLAGACAFLLSQLPWALHPLLDHDDTVYHVLLPRLALDHHALDAPVHNLFPTMPHLVEMGYVFPLALGDFVAVKVFAFAIHFWMAAGLAAFALRHAGRLAAGFAALAYVTGPIVIWHFGTAYVDPAIGLFLLAALLGFDAWWRDDSPAWLLVAGLALGAAAASKYIAWMYAGLLLATFAAAALARHRGDARALARHLAALVVPVVVLVLPWVAMNLVRTGNPVYPALTGIFGGGEWSAVQDLHARRYMDLAGGSPKTLQSWLALPWRLVSDDRLFFDAVVPAGVLLVFVASSLARSAWAGVHGRLRLGAWLCLVAWAAGFQVTRFIVPVLPCMIVASVPARPPRRGVLLAVGLLVVAAAVAQNVLIPVRHMAGREPWSLLARPRAALLERNLNFEVCDFINRNTPADARVLGVFENRFYFLDRPVLYDALYEAPASIAWLRRLDDAGAFAADLARAGVTHVVIQIVPGQQFMTNRFGFDLLDDRVYPAARWERDKSLFDAFMREHTELLAQSREHVILRLRR